MDSCTLFEEDEVYVYNAGKGYKFGIVLENSEYVSSDEEDGQEKQDDRLQKGSIRVAWHPSGKETVVPENKVKLVDRSLMPGDVVRRHVPGKDTQCGFIMDMDVLAHLRILRTNKYIYNVDSRDLKPIQKFQSGQEVIFDLWWGKVENVYTDVELVFPDGARCRVDEADIGGFEDISEKQRRGEFEMCVYYTGQELRGPIDSLCDAKWLHSTPRYCQKVANRIGKSQNVNVSIEKIEARGVEVHWVFGGSNGKESVTTPPPRNIEGDSLKKLKVLDWFANCSLQIGDRELYHIKNDDVIGTTDPSKAFNPQSTLIKSLGIQVDQEPPPEEAKNNEIAAAGLNSGEHQDRAAADEDAEYEDVSDSDESDAESEKAAFSRNFRKKKNKGFKPGAHRFKARPPPPNKTVAKRPKKERVVKADLTVEVEAEFTTSWAKVMWQDGSVESDIPSVDLFPVHHLDELEFFPGDFVLSNNELPLAERPDYGVVASADHSERTCKVHWYKVYDAGKATKDTKPILLEADCEMSVYDLKDHPDYKFRPGLSVVPVGGLNDVLISMEEEATIETTTGDKPISKTLQPEATTTASDGADTTKVSTTKAKTSACQTVGQIYELNPSGHLMVKWSDGTISKRYPQEVFVVSDEADEDSDNEDWESESDYESNASSEESWETESEHEVDADEEIRDKDDSGCDHGNLTEHKTEIDSLLSRAESALNRLQKVINEFDGSIAVPDCFHDIIRIYRSCHELDKILKSSFFSDPELQQLIGQAKGELKKDKNNKISRHLTQLFETWSRSSPNSGNNVRTFGLVGADGKTRTYGNIKPVNIDEKDADSTGGTEGVTDDAVKGDTCDVLEADSAVPPAQVGESQVSTESSEEGQVMKKEMSAPTISGSDLSEGASARRPSDSRVEAGNTFQQEVKSREASLVGENCVAKASKRTKSDGFEDCEREAKKSRDDCANPNQEAQELCFKICKCLQKQILLIHEDMNKRANRLFSAIDKESNTDKKSAEQKTTAESVLEEKDKKNSPSNCDSKSVINDHPPEVTEAGDSLSENTEGVKLNDSKTENHEGLKLNDSLNISEQKQDETNLEEVAEEAAAVSDEEGAMPDVEDELVSPLSADMPCKGFEMVSEAPETHAFFKKSSQPTNLRNFRNAVKKELKLCHSSLPDGIFVQAFENRMDLLSVMILGPTGTPYEDAVFLFDFHLPNDYPISPPVCHYHSHCSDRLNPNLYEDGKVCVSLLGTWSGKGNEMWTAKSTLLQVLLSIQGLILVREPYYNEAGFERQRGTQVGEENSRVYNEMAILKTCQSLTLMCRKPPKTFSVEILAYLNKHGPRMISRLHHWLEIGLAKKSDCVAGESSGAMRKSSSEETAAGCVSCVDGEAETLVTETLGQTDEIFGAVEKHIDLASKSSISDTSEQDSAGHSEARTASPQQQQITDENNLVTKVSDLSLRPVNGDITSDMVEGAVSPVCTSTTGSSLSPPEFPLFPISKGFCITLRNHLKLYEKALQQLNEASQSVEA